MTRAAYGPTWAAYGPRNPSEDGIRQRAVSEHVNLAVSETAGQRPSGAAYGKRPQQDSNLRSRLRRAVPFKALNGPDAPYLAISGDRSGTGISTCSLAAEQAANPSLPKASQTCIKPDDSGQSCDGDCS